MFTHSGPVGAVDVDHQVHSPRHIAALSHTQISAAPRMLLQLLTVRRVQQAFDDQT